jgi:hypothetical protein
MNMIGKNCCKLLLAGVVATAFVPAPTRADVIIDWNTKSDEIAAQKQVPPFNHSRGTAILHVAMFEAVNAIEGRYLPYKLNLAADRTTSKEAAAASAGHDILLALYPDQQSALDATLATMLAGIADGEAKGKGIDLGKKAAADLIALRANDGFDAQETYRPHTTPGTYIPTVVPAFSTSGAVTPWVMRSGSQFRPAAPRR